MAIVSKKVFIDASVFFAFIDRVHPKHEQAVAFFRYFAQEQYRLFTDESSLIETYNRIYKDISPSLAKDFLRIISIGSINVIHPEESDARAALKTLVNYQTTDLTYPKALMAVLANRRDIPHICTFDYLHPLFGQTAFFLPM